MRCRNIRWRLATDLTFVKERPEGQQRIRTGVSSVTDQLMEGDSLDAGIDDAIKTIVDRMECFEGEGSGMKLGAILGVTLYTSAFNPIGGSSYIPSPQWLTKTHTVLIIQNDDDYCFLYCILAHIHPLT